MKTMKLALVAFLVLSLGMQTARAAAPAPVSAEHGMVVSAHRLASDAGVEVLRKGGNAVDAAIAVAYALAVTFPEAGNIGGGGFMTIRLHDGRQTFIDFRETAPQAATASMYQDANGNVIPGLSTRGYRAVAIPGTVAGLELARTRYGSRPRAALMAAAIRLARDGFVLDHGDAQFLNEGAADFAKDGPSARIFMKNGRPWQKGDTFVQADLARMLQAISTKGAPAFYRGEIAQRIIAASRAHGGIMTLADFAAYRAVERKPVECDYRGYHIVSAPLPSSGGVVICETLNILSGYPLGALGFHSAQGVHYMTEALRRAYHDRNVNLGDPDFVKVDVDRLVSADYAATLRAGIAADKATSSLSLGLPGSGHEGKNTTHFSIVDAHGNAVSLTYTLNDWFGARVTPAGTGILLNDEMDDFSSKPGAPNMYGLVEGVNNAIAPGKRPLSSMSPTIVSRDGKLVMVVGTPGGSRIPTGVLQVMINILDHGMTVTEAVNAPRIHAQWLPDVIYYEAHALSADTMESLTARGHKLELMGYGNQIAVILVGGPAVGQAPYGRDLLYGAIDPRLPTGNVAGY
ncbi:gamma-glutamyltransferase [Aquisediminimonas profunda]|uniref:gamma-glutamyltransferase n=1 Tax=Aquisediminimonas profunda TaxID=1550733 RepID=UPI001C632053|nr:gamma-glutamyltransferase [Aquisediminimonas profunda]